MDDYLSRFVHSDLAHIWSPAQNALTERKLWMAVLEAQIKQGLEIPDEDNIMGAYYAAMVHVDLEAMQAREFVTRHDVKARIEVFNERATHEYGGHKRGVQLQYIHLGMTSADVVDNVVLIKLRDSLAWLAKKHELFMSHGLAASIDRMPFRGIKGAIGTMADMADLLGSLAAAEAVDIAVTEHFGFSSLLGSVGQVYPRSIDHEAVSFLYCACLDTHNINQKHPARALLGGYLNMLAATDQWNEGDVSTSVVRRVALPGAMFAADVWLANRDLT